MRRRGVPVWIDGGARIAHAKAIVIDDAVTSVGSMNWTTSAACNSEDLNLIASTAVAAAYSATVEIGKLSLCPSVGGKIGAEGPRCPTSDR